MNTDLMGTKSSASEINYSVPGANSAEQTRSAFPEPDPVPALEKTSKTLSGNEKPRSVSAVKNAGSQSGQAQEGLFSRSLKIIHLLGQRDLASRYRGSLLGRLWPLLHPLGQLLIYSFVFSVVLKIKFGASASTTNFALYFMTGLIPWSIFAESAARASTVILENPNFVTKVVFPLETLPVVNLYSAAGTQMLAFLILLAAVAIFGGGLHATVFLLFIPFICLLAFSAGVSWFLASLGVFIRDTRHMVSLALQAGLYATPILYPAASVPKQYQWIVTANPLSGIIEDCRRLLLEGAVPDLSTACTYAAISFLVCFSGLAFFLKTKKAFADVM